MCLTGTNYIILEPFTMGWSPFHKSHSIIPILKSLEEWTLVDTFFILHTHGTVSFYIGNHECPICVCVCVFGYFSGTLKMLVLAMRIIAAQKYPSPQHRITDKVCRRGQSRTVSNVHSTPTVGSNYRLNFIAQRPPNGCVVCWVEFSGCFDYIYEDTVYHRH